MTRYHWSRLSPELHGHPHCWICGEHVETLRDLEWHHTGYHDVGLLRRVLGAKVCCCRHTGWAHDANRVLSVCRFCTCVRFRPCDRLDLEASRPPTEDLAIPEAEEERS